MFLILGLWIVIAGLLPLFFQRKHFLSVLLLLEVVNLGLFISFLGVINNFGISPFCCLVFITIGVCEAALGLSLLVVVVRNWGNDHVDGFGVTKF
uniref:NADH-ubiquinone oxidoreductase chain 4L n=1 Tax=Myadora brevis TaxID=457650 RepID=A0A1U9XPJ5_9BIVA|nr:NADH dehydrogenase subunit 4L [Myadora brevis]AQZ26168.1 NADH dehydrogenase subunit 4L [Myadora brevis]